MGIFRKIKRPKLVRKGGKARIVRRPAERCPHCGAVEDFKVIATRKTDDQLVRYCVCRACGGKVTRIATL